MLKVGGKNGKSATVSITWYILRRNSWIYWFTSQQQVTVLIIIQS